LPNGGKPTLRRPDHLSAGPLFVSSSVSPKKGRRGADAAPW
jgi:hypothetical protein